MTVTERYLLMSAGISVALNLLGVTLVVGYFFDPHHTDMEADDA